MVEGLTAEARRGTLLKARLRNLAFDFTIEKMQFIFQEIFNHCVSQISPFLHTIIRSIRYYYMVKQRYSHDFPGFCQALRGIDIFSGGRQLAGWMVMGDDDRGSALAYGVTEDLPGMDYRFRYRAGRNHDVFQKAVLVVQDKDAELLTLEACHVRQKEFPHGNRRIYMARLRSPCYHPPSQLKSSVYPDCLGKAYASALRNFPDTGDRKPPQSSKTLQYALGKVDHIIIFCSGGHYHG